MVMNGRNPGVARSSYGMEQYSLESFHLFPQIQFWRLRLDMEDVPNFYSPCVILFRLLISIGTVLTTVRSVFLRYSHIQYSVNDGKALGTVEDNSVDFIFSWDSLVHCEADIFDTYVTEFARILKPNGWGFIHHSNMGVYRDPVTGTLLCDNSSWRGETMTAQLFKDKCVANTLACIRQETVNWSENILNDCFSVFTKNTKNENYEIQYFENFKFQEEIERIAKIAHFYTLVIPEGGYPSQMSSDPPAPEGRFRQRLATRLKAMSLQLKSGKIP